jgi:peptide chain release factor 2
MVILEELKIELVNLRKDVAELGEVFGVENAKDEISELNSQVATEGFWDDLENSQKVLKRVKELDNKISAHKKIADELEDIITFIEMTIEEGNTDNSGENNENAEMVLEITESAKNF